MQIQNLLLGYQFTGRRRKYKYKYKRHTSVIKSNHLDTNLTTDSSAVYWEATEIDAISARVWALDNTPLMVWLEIIGPQQFVSVLSTIHLAFPESFVMLVWIGIIGSQQKTVFFSSYTSDLYLHGRTWHDSSQQYTCPIIHKWHEISWHDTFSHFSWKVVFDWWHLAPKIYRSRHCCLPSLLKHHLNADQA